MTSRGNSQERLSAKDAKSAKKVKNISSFSFASFASFADRKLSLNADRISA
jgi:hypothetical protein